MPAPLRRFIGSHRSVLALFAALLGAICGLASVAFHYCIEGWTWVMTGYRDYSEHLGQGHGYWHIGSWFVIAAPVISGLIYGPMIYRWAPSARGHGIPEVMLAVKRKAGKIPGQVAIVKIIASALTLGGGGSVGREGPIVQVGAALGSALARRTGLDSRRVILLAACGSAAGIAATFNAPLAGSVFALELILVNFTAESFGMVVISAVSASLVSHAFLEDSPVVAIPRNLHVAAASDFTWIIVVAFITALAGLGFSKLLYWIEDLIDAIYRAPEWARPALGGIVIGLMLYCFPAMYGSGYPIQLKGLTGEYTIAFLFLLAAARALFTSVTIAIGGSGGVFAPTLFIGAMVGSACGQALSPFTHTSASVFGVIGMGAAFAGAARAPMTAVLIIVEMTGQYSLIMPMMLAVVIATAISRFLTRKTIYTTKLIRRGDILDDPFDATLVGRLPANRLMSHIPTVLSTSMTLEEANRILISRGLTRLPVVSSQGLYVGCVTSLLIAQAYVSDKPSDSRLRDIDLDRSHVTPSTRPSKVLAHLVSNNASAVPVVDDGELIGWITQKDLVNLIYRQQQSILEGEKLNTSFGSRWLAKHHHSQVSKEE